MPTIYEYLGIFIRFYSNEHEPIHVHAIYGTNIMRASLFLKDGKIYKIEYNIISGKFSPAKMADLTNFVNAYKIEIVKKWTDYFILHKKVKKEKITKKL